MIKTFLIAAAASLLLATGAFALDLDPALPAYKSASGITGELKSVGSDTLGELMNLWAAGFQERYPGVKITVESKGSNTAPPALTDGIAQLAPMSRPMTSDEADAFAKKYGYPPAHFRVAVDALAVYVNKENPIPCLTLQQVDQIFSKTRWGSGGDPITTWGQTGLSGEWAQKPITLYGRNEQSGTHDFFREMVLFKGEFKPEVKEQPDSASVVANVAGDQYAIGYSGIGYKTEGVRTVPLAQSTGKTCFDTSPEATYSGQYPIARYLYVYVNRGPGKPLDPVTAEFVRYVLSRDGQTQTVQGGFYPITGPSRGYDLTALGLQTDSN